MSIDEVKYVAKWISTIVALFIGISLSVPPRKFVLPTDVEMAALTVLGEAENEPVKGRLAVACVIVNRWRDNKFNWKTLTKTVTAHGYSKRHKAHVWQFEPWSRRKIAERLLDIHKQCQLWRHRNDDACGTYSTAVKLVQVAMRHPEVCLHKGCKLWYFANTRIVSKRYNRKPTFDKGQTSVKIGRHTFYCMPS